MTPEALAEAIRPWLRSEHSPAFDAALAWLWPRCRTEEERLLAPALLLLLAPLNALVAPCRPVPGSRLDFQVTLSREGAAGPERIRLNLRSGTSPPEARTMELDAKTPEPQPAPLHPGELWLEPDTVASDPLGAAARVLAHLLDRGRRESA